MKTMNEIILAMLIIPVFVIVVMILCCVMPKEKVKTAQSFLKEILPKMKGKSKTK